MKKEKTKQNKTKQKEDEIFLSLSS